MSTAQTPRRSVLIKREIRGVCRIARVRSTKQSVVSIQPKYKERNDKMTYQLTAPLLDACVLGVVEKEDVYGYTLTQRVMDVVDISESTLYPVLRRLQKSGLLETYDVPYQGRNRRYYRITPPGREQLGFFRSEWITYKDNIDLLLGVNKLLTAN